MNVYFNRTIKSIRRRATTPAMMSALERTAVSVTIDGRTERGQFSGFGVKYNASGAYSPHTTS